MPPALNPVAAELPPKTLVVRRVALAGRQRDLYETVRLAVDEGDPVEAGHPLLFLDDKRKHFELGHLRKSGVTLTAGMIDFPGEDYASIEMIRRTGPV